MSGEVVTRTRLFVNPIIHMAISVSIYIFISPSFVWKFKNLGNLQVLGYRLNAIRFIIHFTIESIASISEVIVVTTLMEGVNSVATLA